MSSKVATELCHLLNLITYHAAAEGDSNRGLIVSLNMTLVVAAQIVALLLKVCRLLGVIVKYANHLECIRGYKGSILIQHQMQAMPEGF